MVHDEGSDVVFQRLCRLNGERILWLTPFIPTAHLYRLQYPRAPSLGTDEHPIRLARGPIGSGVEVGLCREIASRERLLCMCPYEIT